MENFLKFVLYAINIKLCFLKTEIKIKFQETSLVTTKAKKNSFFPTPPLLLRVKVQLKFVSENMVHLVVYHYYHLLSIEIY